MTKEEKKKIVAEGKPVEASKASVYITPMREVKPITLAQEKRVILTFRENRAFELHIGNNVTRFEGRESKVVSERVVKHKDFTEQTAKKFIITGVN